MKNKNIFLQPVLFIAFVIFNVTSQSTVAQIDFERIYHYWGGCHGQSIVQTSDGGYAVFSDAGPYFGAHTSMMYRINQYGDSLWLRVYINRYMFYACGLPDGGFAMFGRQSSGSASWDGIITRVDSLGNEIWEQVYSGSNSYYPLSMCPASDGGFVVTGVNSNTKFRMVKTDSAGNIIWYQNHFGSGGKTIQTADGGYVIAGREETQNNDWDFRITKTDSAGNLTWEKDYMNGVDLTPKTIIQTSDGGYLVLGASNGDSISILKLDATGDSLWEKRFFISGGWFGAEDVVQTDDDGYAICGHTFATVSSAFLLKTNSSGDSITIKLYPNDMGTWFFGMSATSDNEIIMCGSSYTLPDSLINTFVVKTDSFGTLTNVSAQKPSAPSFTLNPNPATGQLRLSFPAGKLPGSLVIQNALGEVVTTVKIYSHDQLVDVSYLSQGIYVIKSNDGIQVKKFVKQ